MMENEEEAEEVVTLSSAEDAVSGDVDQKLKTAEEMTESAEVENPHNEILAPNPSSTTGIEYSFGTFFNWFMPSCMDQWTTDDNAGSSNQNHETIIAYGARSFLFLLDVKLTGGSVGDPAAKNDYDIHYRDLVNVFDHRAPKKFTDVFRSTNAYVTTVVFEKTRDYVGRSNYCLAALENRGPRVFVGNSDGAVAVYDIHRRTTVLQDLPFTAFKRPCCRKVGMGGHCKILSAAWVHFRDPETGGGSVVFYPLDCHLVRWEVDRGRVEVVHYQDKTCDSGNDGLRLFGQLPISCLVAMSAEATADRGEHRLAVGFNGGKLAILSFSALTGAATALVLLTDAAHHDDICSLAFSPYSIGSVAAYRSGLLVSVSRDAVLKVWSLGGGGDSVVEIAEYRISSGNLSASASSNSRKGPSEGLQSKCNWFAAAFLPRSALVQQSSNFSASNSNSNSNSSKPPSYEILVTAPTGELVTLTLPDRAPSSKLRIAKANKFTSRGAGVQLQKNNSDGDNHQGHQSVVFSIMVGGRSGIAVTYSLDYKMILWELSSRTACGRFHLFANGALAIDCCLKDRRLAVAFGSSVYTLDFGDQGSSTASLSTSRLTTAPKSWKFYQVSWNNVSDSERLGSLALGNSNGEVLHYDLNERTFIGKAGKPKNPSGLSASKGGGGDASKIYKFVWPVKLFAGSGEPPRTAVLSLHASGTILINYVPSRHLPNRPAENFMTAKYVAGLPTIEGGNGNSVNLLRKHSALDAHDRGRVLVVGNDDGTVDLLKSVEVEDGETPPYQHQYRFRAFTKPIISVEASGDGGDGGGLWLAITAMHDNFVHCYRLETTTVDEDNGSLKEEEEFKESFTTSIFKRQPTKYKLSGHSDRVAATSWSPFSNFSKVGGAQQQKLLVTASYDTSCIVWEVVSQRPLHRFTGHRSLIYTIKWSHFREDLIFSGGEDAFHAWRWPEQPKFEDNDQNLGSGVALVKLREVLKKKQVEVKKEEKKEVKEVMEEKKVEVITNSTNSISSSKSSKATEQFASLSSHQTPLPPAKALFSLSNQIEYSSSKAEMLEDLAAIVRLKIWAEEADAENSVEVPEEVVPENVLKRVLLYSPRLVEVRRFLELERENHLQNNSRGGLQNDAAELLSMMADLKGAIERAIEEGEADLQLATYASGYSRALYLRCLDSYWKGRGSLSKVSTAKTHQSSSTRSARLLLNYSREMEALSRLAVFGDFQGAVEGLLQPQKSGTSSGLYREALVLAKVNLASRPVVDGLWERWYRARLSAGQTEGAAKCLVTTGRWAEALALLEGRKRLCAETSGEKVMTGYQVVIDLLKKILDDKMTSSED